MNAKFLSVEPDRSLDQYFVADEILDREIQLAELSRHDVVLEIGAGPGNLTERITKRCKVIAIEKDERFIPHLKRIRNAEIIHGDALEVLKAGMQFNKVVSNIPYSISQPLLLALLKRSWQSAVMIVQKEFAEKLAANTKLGMLVKDCCELRTVMTVPKDYFYPAPAFDSSMIVLRQRKTMDEGFWRFLSSAYRSKNRDVKNVFKRFPQELGRKKVHQLAYEEIKALHEMNR